MPVKYQTRLILFLVMVSLGRSVAAQDATANTLEIGEPIVADLEGNESDDWLIGD